ncbi:hypothetical protein GCN78_08055 [Janthinobacterium rivuli]|uniref:hypothetical protein n=1 Tax=Janthinobacterium sp. FT68W TaxID=2654255 RepID=UPI001264EA84|nr:hypothetical protein [Janthinobacterium sp. FT68W]KAB8052539.1 hypothetical protein GCN78_08055 [Janthinobacterium sp. FT68W]
MAGISAVSGGTGFIPTQSKKDVTSAASAAEQKIAAPVSEPPQGANAEVAGATASKAPNGAAALSNTLQSQYDASRVDTSAVDGRTANTETGSADMAEAGGTEQAGAADASAGGDDANLTATASSSETYEAEDKNENGEVTEQERADYKETNAYLNKHPEAAANAKVKVAVDAYVNGAASFAEPPRSAIATQA